MSRLIRWMFFCVLAVSGARAHSADTIVLCDTMSSELKGEVTLPYASGCIALDSWSWGAERPYSFTGTGPVASAQPAPVTLQKVLDSSSTSLLKFLLNGVSPQGTLEIRVYKSCSGSCSNPQPYFTLDLTKVVVISQTLGQSDGGSSATENVSLGFQTIKICYAASNTDGSLQTPVCVTYNASTNIAN